MAIAALNAGKYLTGPYAAIPPGGQIGDAQASIVYDAGSDGGSGMNRYGVIALDGRPRSH